MTEAVLERQTTKEVLEKHTIEPAWEPSEENPYVISPVYKGEPGPTRADVSVDFYGDPREGSDTEQANYYLHTYEDAKDVGRSVDGLYAGQDREEAQALIEVRQKLIDFMHQGTIPANEDTIKEFEDAQERAQIQINHVGKRRLKEAFMAGLR